MRLSSLKQIHKRESAVVRVIPRRRASKAAASKPIKREPLEPKTTNFLKPSQEASRRGPIESIKQETSETPATKSLSAITPKASAVSILDLPQELRLKLYSLLFGDGPIHLRSVQQTQYVGYIRPNANHDDLSQPILRDMRDFFNPWPVWNYQTVHLGLLGTCKQLHREVSHALYTTKTFCFSDPVSFRQWMIGSSSSNRHDIRSLALDIYDVQDWNRSFRLPQMQDLTNLQHLHLQITRSDFWSRRANFRSGRRDHNQNAWRWFDNCKELRRLSRSPLQSLTIKYGYPSHIDSDVSLLKAEVFGRLSQDLRRALLSHG